MRFASASLALSLSLNLAISLSLALALSLFVSSQPRRHKHCPVFCFNNDDDTKDGVDGSHSLSLARSFSLAHHLPLVFLVLHL